MSDPIYLKTFRDGKFEKKRKIAGEYLQNCTVCPRNCKVNRNAGELGECKINHEVVVSSYFSHFGEETPLVGNKGSGTIFMAGCNLQCLFCQNYETSHLMEGTPISFERLAEMMLELQEMGCHNVNIVTPSHVVPQLIDAVYLAVREGLHLPIVYNSSGYDAISSLKLLDGIIDIYMPDFKFFDDVLAARYTAVKNYATIARKAVMEMHRQVGDLIIENGIAKKGLLIRHLVMPGYLEDSKKIFHFIATEISMNTYLNVMPQYRPAGEANRHLEISRPLHSAEFYSALKYAKDYGLCRLDKDF
jgi:putative pyruvate formate lyase activating enzyme